MNVTLKQQIKIIVAANKNYCSKVFLIKTNYFLNFRYKSNKKLFMEKVRECVVLSIDHIYDDPPTEDKHFITFKPYDPDVHDNAKNMMLKTPTNECANQGISWVQQGSFQPFSKEETT